MGAANVILSQYSCVWQDDLTAMLGISLRGRKKEENEDGGEKRKRERLAFKWGLGTGDIPFQTQALVFY